MDAKGSTLSDLTEKAAELVNRRLLTGATAIATLTGVFAVRQLRILMAPYGLVSWTPVVGLASIAYLFLLVAWVGSVNHPDRHPQKPGRGLRVVGQVIGNLWHRLLLALRDSSVPKPIHVAWESTPRWVRNWAVPAVLMTVGLTLMLRPDRWALASRQEGATLFGWHILVVGIWMCSASRRLFMLIVGRSSYLVSRIFGESAPVFDWKTAVKTVSRAVVAMLLASLVGETLWHIASRTDNGLYSVWGLANLIFWCVMGARVADNLYLHGAYHVRKLAIVGFVAISIAWPQGVRIGRSKIGGDTQISDSKTADTLWYRTIDERLQWTGDDGPILLVAASGGGSRAALFASLVYETLRIQTTAVELGLNPIPLSDRIVFTSSVSGGSLATGYFRERSAKDPRASAVEIFSDKSQFDRDHPYADRVLQQIRKLDNDLAAKKQSTAPTRAQPWPLQSAFVADMTTDFMAPLLRGVLNIGRERGDAVSDFWRERFHWRDDNLTQGKRGTVPISFFNATQVERGTRMVVSFPPAPSELLAPGAADRAYHEQGLRISTDEAVRVSANFPWGFEVAQFKLPQTESAAIGSALLPTTSDDDEEASESSELLNVIDGGVVDNTGLDTLATMLERLRDVRANGTDPNVTRLLEAMVRRGIVLVEVDAGARPGAPNGIAKLFPTITQPIQALEQAGYVNESVIRTRNLRRIREALELFKVTVAVVRAGFPCDPRGDVMTAWALSRKDQARIIRSFLDTESRFVTNLQTVISSVAIIQKTGDEILRKENRYRLDRYVEKTLNNDNAERSASAGCPDYTAISSEEAIGSKDLLSFIRSHATPKVAATPDPALTVVPMPQPVRTRSAPRPARPVSVAAVHPTPPPQPPPPTVAVRKKEGSPDSLDSGSSYPEMRVRLMRIGWIYVGEKDRETGRWQSAIAEGTDTETPTAGKSVTIGTRTTIRSSPPAESGEVGAAIGTVEAGTSLNIREVIHWQGTSFVWARVSW